MTLCSGINCSSPARISTASTTIPAGSDWESALGWIIYMDFLYGYLYFLSIMAPIGLILNILSFVVLLFCKNLSNSSKDHYVYNAGMNILLSISVDILVSMLRGITFYLNNSGNLSANLQVDTLNSVICAGHNYVNPVLEFIWLWNAVNFSLRRCLVVWFPFRANLISKLMNWRLMAAQVAFGCALWWFHLVNYTTVCYNISPTVTSCVCYNPSYTVGSWQQVYTLIARQYLTYAATIVLLVTSDVCLIVKLISSAKNRRQVVKMSVAQTLSTKNTVQSRLTNSVIIFSTLYLVIVVPTFLINTFLNQIYLISSPYLVYGLTFYNYFIGKTPFVLLRIADFVLLFATVRECRNSVIKLFTKVSKKFG